MATPHKVQEIDYRVLPFTAKEPLGVSVRLSMHDKSCMLARMRTASRKTRRTSNACMPCRQSKIKCTGDFPCFNCLRRRIQCQFAGRESMVTVQERYLRDLQNQAKQARRLLESRRTGNSSTSETGEGTGTIQVRSPPQSADGRALLAPPIIDAPCSIWTSPFTLPSAVMRHTHADKRNWIWLAPASPWSFTARLTLMMTKMLSVKPASDFPDFHLDGDIYQVDWNDTGVLDPLSTSGLPPFSYALYLFETTKFHLGQIYRIFDADSFKAGIHDLYERREPAATPSSRIWFIQFLLVLAFGSAFLSRKPCRSPPCSRFFARAMHLMPKRMPMGKESFLMMETLALVSLYLYALDYREEAHINLGQAMRIAQLDGLHTHLPEGDLGPSTIARCQNLWWSLYILDRQISFSLGLPMATQDAEITTLVKAPEGMPHDSVFSLQVRLSQMQTFILSEIYRTEKTQLGPFLEITRNILHNMAELAEEIEMLSPEEFQGSMELMPQETRHVILLYHQCVIIATRPLLLSVLKERLEKLGRQEEDWRKFLTLPKSLISIGINSAEKMLQILSDESLSVEVFLPCDLEFTFAAALHLTMGNTLFHPEVPDLSNHHVAHSVLEHMIKSGNRVAEARKNELERLERLFQEFDNRIKQQGLRTLSLATLEGHREDRDLAEEAHCQAFPPQLPVSVGSSGVSPTQGAVSDETPRPESYAESIQGNLDFYNSMGISSYEFLSIADQIRNGDYSLGALDPNAGWLDGYEMTGAS